MSAGRQAIAIPFRQRGFHTSRANHRRTSRVSGHPCPDFSVAGEHRRSCIANVTCALSRVGYILTSMLAVIFLVAVFPVNLHAEMAHGFAEFHAGPFDFSEQANGHPFTADVGLAIIVDPPEGWRLLGLNARIRVVPDSSLTEVTTAPTDTTEYVWEAPVLLGVTYIVWTFDGYYAKFVMRQWLPNVIAEFEYYVQLDGTPILATPVATQSTTWGRIKAMYQ